MIYTKPETVKSNIKIKQKMADKKDQKNDDPDDGSSHTMDDLFNYLVPGLVRIDIPREQKETVRNFVKETYDSIQQRDGLFEMISQSQDAQDIGVDGLNDLKIVLGNRQTYEQILTNIIAEGAANLNLKEHSLIILRKLLKKYGSSALPVAEQSAFHGSKHQTDEPNFFRISIPTPEGKHIEAFGKSYVDKRSMAHAHIFQSALHGLGCNFAQPLDVLNEDSPGRYFMFDLFLDGENLEQHFQGKDPAQKLEVLGEAIDELLVPMYMKTIDKTKVNSKLLNAVKTRNKKRSELRELKKQLEQKVNYHNEFIDKVILRPFEHYGADGLEKARARGLQKAAQDLIVFVEKKRGIEYIVGKQKTDFDKFVRKTCSQEKESFWTRDGSKEKSYFKAIYNLLRDIRPLIERVDKTNSKKIDLITRDCRLPNVMRVKTEDANKTNNGRKLTPLEQLIETNLKVGENEHTYFGIDVEQSMYGSVLQTLFNLTKEADFRGEGEELVFIHDAEEQVVRYFYNQADNQMKNVKVILDSKDKKTPEEKRMLNEIKNFRKAYSNENKFFEAYQDMAAYQCIINAVRFFDVSRNPARVKTQEEKEMYETIASKYFQRAINGLAGEMNPAGTLIKKRGDILVRDMGKNGDEFEMVYEPRELRQDYWSVRLAESLKEYFGNEMNGGLDVLLDPMTAIRSYAKRDGSTSMSLVEEPAQPITRKLPRNMVKTTGEKLRSVNWKKLLIGTAAAGLLVGATALLYDPDKTEQVKEDTPISEQKPDQEKEEKIEDKLTYDNPLLNLFNPEKVEVEAGDNLWNLYKEHYTTNVCTGAECTDAAQFASDCITALENKKYSPQIKVEGKGKKKKVMIKKEKGDGYRTIRPGDEVPVDSGVVIKYKLKMNGEEYKF